MTEMIFPRRLSAGDTLGVVAPAGPFDRERFDRGTGVLMEMGFNLYIPEGLFQGEGYLAGSDGHRAEMVDRLFSDSGIDAVICARGGYGAMRILSRLDFANIRKHPKPFIGFSDISALLWAINERAGLACFHGPMVTSLADADGETKRSLLSALTEGGPMEIVGAEGKGIVPGVAVGRLSGGNLATLCHLAGTPFAPSWEGHILLIEDVAEPLYKIDRMLTQLKLSGALSGVAGVALGTFEQCPAYEEVCKVVARIFEGTGVPVAAGFPVGHSKRNMTVPLGIPATLDADEGTLSFELRAE